MDVRGKQSNEKRLIDANELKKSMCFKCNDEYSDDPCEPGDCVFCNAINDAQTIDAVSVVRCEKCVLHGNCITEDYFAFAGIENPFCCAGKQKEGAD